MSLPRPVRPGCFYLVSRRCTQRQFLLRPDPATNDTFTYCLIQAAERSGIEVVLPCAMSNHWHGVIYDRDGTYPAFLAYFHMLLARSINALRRRWENLWAAAEQTSVVQLVNLEDVMAKLVYVATNPVETPLVAEPHHWPGVNGFANLCNGKPLTATRPGHFFHKEGAMPAEVSMALRFPAELGDHDTLVAQLRTAVAARVKELAAQHRKAGVRILGRKGVLAQSWRASPSSEAPRRNLSPRIACRNRWGRIEALARRADFVRDYTEARRAILAGLYAVLPAGTYGLRRFVKLRGFTIAPFGGGPTVPIASN